MFTKKTKRIIALLISFIILSSLLIPNIVNASSSRFIAPVTNSNTRITSLYGYRIHPITNMYSFHSGVDIAGPRGTVIHSTANGVVVNVSTTLLGGNEIWINHGGGIQSRYLHLEKRAQGLERGSVVRQGQPIGIMGTTGRSTGIHLHFEIRENGKPIDPVFFINNN